MAGLPDRARKRAGEAVGLALKLDHPFSKCYAQFHYGLLQLWLGNPEIVQERARALTELAEEHEFQIWNAVSSCLHGAALVALGAASDGLPMMAHGMQVYQGLKSPPIFWPLLLQLQAGAYGMASRPADGLPLLEEAIRLTPASSVDPYTPEILGLKGDLLLALSADQAVEAERCYQQAINIARELHASMLELRAALRLSRLWREQGKTQEARDVLSTAYAKMTEGFSLPDLIQAQTLLNELT
jgi:tetratricopeptide (TPR) repeat protein